MLERNSLHLILNSLSKESGIDGIAVYNSSAELLGSSFVNDKVNSLAKEIRETIELTYKSTFECSELFMSSGDNKLMLNFFNDICIVIYSNAQLDYGAFSLVLSLASKKIEKICSNTSSSNYGNSRLLTTTSKNISRRRTVKEQDKMLSVMLKKILCDLEGPIGSIIYKKAIRSSNFNVAKQSKDELNKLIYEIMNFISTNNKNDFEFKAQKIIKECFN
jgi:hypothetical protein